VAVPVAAEAIAQLFGLALLASGEAGGLADTAMPSDELAPGLSSITRPRLERALTRAVIAAVARQGPVAGIDLMRVLGVSPEAAAEATAPE
jgi:hypothetical protein